MKVLIGFLKQVWFEIQNLCKEPRDAYRVFFIIPLSATLSHIEYTYNKAPLTIVNKEDAFFIAIFSLLYLFVFIWILAVRKLTIPLCFRFLGVGAWSAVFHRVYFYSNESILGSSLFLEIVILGTCVPVFLYIGLGITAKEFHEICVQKVSEWKKGKYPSKLNKPSVHPSTIVQDYA